MTGKTLAVLLTAAVTVGVAIFTHVDAASDCTAYVTELAALQQHYPPTRLESALRTLKADTLQHYCGNAVDFEKALNGP